MLYLMCLQYRDGGSYNGYLIDDILIDKYNKTHSKISVIAVNWTNSSDSTCLAECELVSVGKQICK